MKSIQEVLVEYEYLNEKPLKQFILLADYLNVLENESCRFRVDSLSPVDISFHYHFKNRYLHMMLCTNRLKAHNKEYEVDNINTLFVQIRDVEALEIITDTLHRTLQARIKRKMDKISNN